MNERSERARAESQRERKPTDRTTDKEPRREACRDCERKEEREGGGLGGLALRLFFPFLPCLNIMVSHLRSPVTIGDPEILCFRRRSLDYPGVCRWQLGCRFPTSETTESAVIGPVNTPL